MAKKLSTGAKIALVVVAAGGVYLVARSLKKSKKEEAGALAPSEPSGKGLPPSGGGGGGAGKPAAPSTPYNPELRGAEAATVTGWHAQWAAGNLEDQLRQALGSNINADRVANVLTDWAYKDLYGNAVYPIPSNWQGTSWAPYADAWKRMKAQMKPMVVETWAGGEGAVS